MITALTLLLSMQTTQLPVGRTDTLRLDVGSVEIDGRIFPEHRARNRVYIGDNKEPTTTWTNELTLGDSAGIKVMRWTTRGQTPTGSWELLQTYNARTLAPLRYSLTSSTGAVIQLQMNGKHVRGVKRTPGDTTMQQVDQTLGRAGFIASASDLIPLAVGLRKGAVMTAPVWGPNMPAAETRIFTVVGEEPVTVEGATMTAWKVLEQVEGTAKLVATWYLVDRSPYMVLAEIPLANGQTQRITGVALQPGEQ